MQLKYCVIFMKSRKLSIEPTRRPRSMSMQFGGDETLTKAMCRSPIRTRWAGLRGVMSKARGARRTFSSTKARSIRTLSPETAQPAALRMAFASSFRNSMPISSSTRIAVSWTAATPSSVSGSVGRSVLTGSRQGVWAMARAGLRPGLRAWPPARRFRSVNVGSSAAGRPVVRPRRRTRSPVCDPLTAAASRTPPAGGAPSFPGAPRARCRTRATTHKLLILNSKC